jgi:hypothetical protein
MHTSESDVTIGAVGYLRLRAERWKLRPKRFARTFDTYRRITVTERGVRTAQLNPRRMTLRTAFFILINVLTGRGGEMCLSHATRANQNYGLPSQPRDE